MRHYCAENDLLLSKRFSVKDIRQSGVSSQDMLKAGHYVILRMVYRSWQCIVVKISFVKKDIGMDAKLTCTLVLRQQISLVKCIPLVTSCIIIRSPNLIFTILLPVRSNGL
jgi:hypothetical protein